jgi:hypothetical protein
MPPHPSGLHYLTGSFAISGQSIDDLALKSSDEGWGNNLKDSQDANRNHTT